MVIARLPRCVERLAPDLRKQQRALGALAAEALRKQGRQTTVHGWGNLPIPCVEALLADRGDGTPGSIRWELARSIYEVPNFYVRIALDYIHSLAGLEDVA